MPFEARRWAAAHGLATLLGLAACGDPPEEPEEPQAGCAALPDEVSWFRSSTSNAANDWNDVKVDADGNIWLAGFADGTLGATAVEPSGNSRGVLRQLAPDGRVLWDSGTSFDTPGTDVAEALLLLPQGQVVVAGRTTGVLAGSNAGQFDTFVAQGTPTAGWRVMQTGTAAPQRPSQLAAAADGDFALVGYDDTFIPTNYLDRLPDPFVLRLQAGSGTAPPQLRWQHRLDSTASDVASAVAPAPDGTTYFAYTVDTGPDRGIYLRRLNAAGEPLWTQRYTDIGLDNIAALHLQADGSLWMAGTAHGAFDGQPTTGVGGVFIARVAGSDGRLLQSWRHGSGSADRLADMAIDRDGNFVLFGETVGSWVPGQRNAGQADLFLLRVSPTGQRLAVRQWGTADDDASGRLALDACGNALAVGSSTTITAGRRRAGLLWFWRRP